MLHCVLVPCVSLEILEDGNNQCDELYFIIKQHCVFRQVSLIVITTICPLFSTEHQAKGYNLTSCILNSEISQDSLSGLHKYIVGEDNH